jgi:8-oxo-dGTP pyrophosphatase MutT (NUDIX family)
MLLFTPLDPDRNLDAVRRHGLQSDTADGRSLYPSLDAARAAASGPILVVDALALDRPSPPDAGPASVSSVPPSTLLNLDPYRPPKPVVAAGGYVCCPLPDDVALLLIHRRGVWDLPKGHQDPGEDLDTCALREVREEVGIDDLRLIRDLGTTQHGYPEGETYAVKTTYWYLMRTAERTFRPEREEGIRRVAPARWAVARRHIGYDTLRHHMDRVEDDVRTAIP